MVIALFVGECKSKWLHTGLMLEVSIIIKTNMYWYLERSNENDLNYLVISVNFQKKFRREEVNKNKSQQIYIYIYIL